MKKIVLSFFTLVVIAFGVVFSSCDSGGLFNNCEANYSFERENLFVFNLLDAHSRDNLLQITYNRYNTQDTVKIYDSEWNIIYPGPVRGDGLIGFSIVDEETDWGVVDITIKKTFYLYLEAADIDTIQVDFEMEMNSCDEQKMTYMKFQFNDSIYFDQLTGQVPEFSFLKK